MAIGNHPEMKKETDKKPSANAEDDAKDRGEEEEEAVETFRQIRITFRLAPEFRDDSSSLDVGNETIAIPSHLTRKGLSTVLNHLLGRDEVQDEVDDEDEGEKDDNSSALPPLQFEFLVGPHSRRLLRTTLDKEARQAGLSLEQDVQVTYFPSTPAPNASEDKGPELPDWISSLQTIAVDGNSSSSFLVSACYDGSLHILQPENDENANQSSMKPLASTGKAHAGPIKCMDVCNTDVGSTESKRNSLPAIWIATGSMDHTVALHTCKLQEDGIRTCATAQHAANVSSVKFWPPQNSSKETLELKLASGDWDGGVFVWRYNPLSYIDDVDARDDNAGPTTKRLKATSVGATASRQSIDESRRLTPTISLQAHNAKVSGLSCYGRGGYNELMITSSWDHSIKVWNIERQDCLMTLNSSRVVGCLDSSPHSAGICVTGHPDCSLRLWDMRVDDGKDGQTNKNRPSILLSDNVFRPSHEAWISQVYWSHRDPYQIFSCSHDGTLKLWDIRSATPLHTVRVLPPSPGNYEKLLALATLGSDRLFTGGTTRVVEQFRIQRFSEPASM